METIKKTYGIVKHYWNFVKFLNKKYDKYFTIKYKCYYKVKNPPGQK